MKRVLRAARWLVAAMVGLVAGSLAAALKRRPESEAARSAETGAGEA